MSHMGQDLGIYFGDYKFEYAKGGFTHIQLPKWKMEKKIDWVDFFSDEVEVLFSGIDIGLT